MKKNSSNSNNKKSKIPGFKLIGIIILLFILIVLAMIGDVRSSDCNSAAGLGCFGQGMALVLLLAMLIYGPIVILGVYFLWSAIFSSYSKDVDAINNEREDNADTSTSDKNTFRDRPRVNYERFDIKRFPGIRSFRAIALLILGFFVIYNGAPILYYSAKVRIEEAKLSKIGTVGKIERKTVCIKENNKYVTYVVADNKYGFTKNSLLVRKNALNKKIRYYKYPQDYKYRNYYDNSYIDEFLISNEWMDRFDKSFLDKVNNTLLYQSNRFLKHDIVRKFFIVSTYEYFGFQTEDEWYKMAYTGGMDDDWSYYETENGVTDDDGNEILYWATRIDDINSGLVHCSPAGCWPLSHDDNSEQYFRPAFTIPNNTKIKKNRNKEYPCKYFLDI